MTHPETSSGPATAPSDAILTVPNLITLARLALIPVYIWLALGAEKIGAAWIVGFVAGGSDWVDGRVARRYGQVSKLGITIDPLVDRLLLGGAAAVFIVAGWAPLWLIVAVIARDGLLLASVPLLSARGIERPPVSWFGKAGTFGIMWGFGLFHAAQIPADPIEWMRVFAWVCAIPGLAFSYIAAADYARTVVGATRAPGTG